MKKVKEEKKKKMSYVDFESGGYTQSTTKKPLGETVHKDGIFPMNCLSLHLMETNSKKNFLFKGIVLNYVSVCGKIVDIEHSNELVKYTIDDTTGFFVVGHYSVQDEPEPEFKVNDYIKAVGKIRAYSKDKYIMEIKVIKADVNMMMTHLIECAYALKKQGNE